MCIRVFIENCLLPFCKCEQAKIFDGKRHRSILKYYDPFWLRTTASVILFFHFFHARDLVITLVSDPQSARGEQNYVARGGCGHHGRG
jgi:hypothetical protein